MEGLQAYQWLGIRVFCVEWNVDGRKGVGEQGMVEGNNISTYNRKDLPLSSDRS